MNRTLGTILALLVLLVLFFAVNTLAQAMLRSARVDLTENNLYTISEGAKNIARGVDEPIRL